MSLLPHHDTITCYQLTCLLEECSKVFFEPLSQLFCNMLKFISLNSKCLVLFSIQLNICKKKCKLLHSVLIYVTYLDSLQQTKAPHELPEEFMVTRARKVLQYRKPSCRKVSQSCNMKQTGRE